MSIMDQGSQYRYMTLQLGVSILFLVMLSAGCSKDESPYTTKTVSPALEENATPSGTEAQGRLYSTPTGPGDQGVNEGLVPPNTPPPPPADSPAVSADSPTATQ